MMTAWLITVVLLACLAAMMRRRALVDAVCALFCILQAGFAAWVVFVGQGSGGSFFRFDPLGALLMVLMGVVAPAVFLSSRRYLDTEGVNEYKLYSVFMMLLCGAISGVYFAANVAVTWIMLEATTLCAAGLVYHRRTPRSLEATWKYLFVCSTGIAIAYLGILLLGTASVDGDLSYAAIAQAVVGGNPLYMKLAFLFMLVGYSCKLEVFPLYAVGIDANSAVPAPASALISTALVNAGFVAVYRVYRLFAESPAFPWMCSVLIIAGLLSMLMGTFFMRRTNHYKRLFAYSTVENMGIVLIGLGIGGSGVVAALLHITAHSLIKSGLFLQIARVGRTAGTYRINRIGGYMKTDALGAVTMLVMTTLLLAFPPSPLFWSEVGIMGAAFGSGRWWVVALMVAMVCMVMYNLVTRVLRLCYKDGGVEPAPAPGGLVGWLPAALAALAVLLGVWQWPALAGLFNAIVQ